MAEDAARELPTFPLSASYLRIEERVLEAGLNQREPRLQSVRRLVRGICTAP
jgi:hypothetical protein